MALAGGATTPPATILEDASLTQVIDVRDTVRRSLTIAGSEGIFFGQLRHEHPGPGALANTIDPYAAGGNSFPGYPTPTPRGYDIWLLGATVARDAGAGTLDGAFLSMSFLATATAFQRNNDGTSEAAGVVLMPLARWDSLDTTTGLDAVGLTEDGESYVPIGHRIRRGSRLQFDSDVAGAAADIQCNMLLGVFPITLGQDVAS